MSSFIRRIQRQQHPSQAVHYTKTGELYANPPRKKFYKDRGRMLGVCNPKAKDLLARLVREARSAERRAGTR